MYNDPYYGSIYWRRSYPRSIFSTNAQVKSFESFGYHFDYNKVKRNYYNAISNKIEKRHKIKNIKKEKFHPRPKIQSYYSSYNF